MFRVTTFGESHGQGVGVVIDGCPPRLPLDRKAIQSQLDRRRPGTIATVSSRREPDRVEILSGVDQGLTLGTPIALLVANRDARPADYAPDNDVPRPSHADYTYQAKYGIRAGSGGGRASARETVGRVAAGAVAEIVLHSSGVEIVAWAGAIGQVEAVPPDSATITREQVDANPTRAPGPEDSARMQAAIEEAMAEQDSLGGIVTCVCRGLPAGWGEPVFDKLEAELAHAMLSIPAAKGFEVGSGFAGSRMRGSEHNDLFVPAPGNGDGTRLATATNFSGGIQGGLSNGQPVVFRVAFKPAPTIGRPQESADFQGRPATLRLGGRHDPCVVPRAVPVVESMAAITLADAALRNSRMLFGRATR